MIYFDGIHLISDESIAELHRFAKKIGLRRPWFQADRKRGGNASFPHYDVIGGMVGKALVAGARRVNSKRDIIAAMERFRKADNHNHGGQ